MKRFWPTQKIKNPNRSASRTWSLAMMVALGIALGWWSQDQIAVPVPSTPAEMAWLPESNRMPAKTHSSATNQESAQVAILNAAYNLWPAQAPYPEIRKIMVTCRSIDDCLVQVDQETHPMDQPSLAYRYLRDLGLGFKAGKITGQFWARTTLETSELLTSPPQNKKP